MILFENVTKIYPRTTRPALRDVSLEVSRGEFVFIVGTSGSGKSTLMQLVMREQDASSGRILVAGRELDRLPDRKVPALRRDIGCVFQDFRLLPNKTVFQNVAYALQVLGSSRARIRQTVPETLELVGLEGMEKRLPHQLSGGEQQRVAIARAFVNRPQILLADEPTGNLDPQTSLGIVQLLDRIHRVGTTVVMATHDTVTVDAMRKRVIRLDNGVVISDIEGSDYTTGSIPPVRVNGNGTREGNKPDGTPRDGSPAPDNGHEADGRAKPNGHDPAYGDRACDAASDAANEDHDEDADDPDALPPIGRDAVEPSHR